MKLYHATANIEIAEEIVESGFVAQFDHNHQAKVVSLADKPLAGFGSWQDAWVVVDIPENVADEFHYDFDDDMYKAQCYAFPDSIINQFSMYATTTNEYYNDEDEEI